MEDTTPTQPDNSVPPQPTPPQDPTPTEPIVPVEAPATQPLEVPPSPYELTPATPPDTSIQTVSTAPVVAQSQQPQTVAAAATSTPDSPKPKSKKLLVSLLVIGLLVVLCLGGGAYAYTQYQKPSRVLYDAYRHAATSHQFSVTSVTDLNYPLPTTNGPAITVKNVTVHGKFNDAPAAQADATLNLTIAGKDYGVKGSGILANNGDLYFRFDNVSNVVQSYYTAVGGNAQSYNSFLKPVLTSLENKWVKVAYSDLKNDTQSAAAQSYVCSYNALQQATKTNDSATQNADMQNYQNNPFLKVDKELPPENDMLRYQVSIDRAKFQTFTKTDQQSPLSKALSACDKTAKTADTGTVKSSLSDTSVTTVVAVSRWSHELKKVTIDTITKQANGSDLKTSTTMTPDFNTSVTVTPPTNATPYQEWVKSLTSSNLTSAL